MLRLIAIWLAIGCPLAAASEVDSYTGHPETLANARPALDAIMNRRVALAARRANRRDRASGVCDEEVLYHKLVRQLVGGPGGFIVASRVERAVIHDRHIDQIRTRLKDSIYRDYGVHRLPTMIGGGLASLLAVDEHLVGTDKLGHFVAVGWEYFVRVERRGLLAHHDEQRMIGRRRHAGAIFAAVHRALQFVATAPEKETRVDAQ